MGLTTEQWENLARVLFEGKDDDDVDPSIDVALGLLASIPPRQLSDQTLLRLVRVVQRLYPLAEAAAWELERRRDERDTEPPGAP
jgi:hypothetical protein